MAKKKENLKEGNASSDLATLKENLRVLRFNSGATKTKNVKEQKALRKQIARILTVMNGVQK